MGPAVIANEACAVDLLGRTRKTKKRRKRR